MHIKPAYGAKALMRLQSTQMLTAQKNVAFVKSLDAALKMPLFARPLYSRCVSPYAPNLKRMESHLHTQNSQSCW